MTKEYNDELIAGALDKMSLKVKTERHRLSLLELLTEPKMQYFSTKKNFETFERKDF